MGRHRPRRFSRSGYRVTAGYLWFAEGGLLLIWLIALGYALTERLARPPFRPAGLVGRRAWRWLAGRAG